MVEINKKSELVANRLTKFLKFPIYSPNSDLGMVHMISDNHEFKESEHARIEQYTVTVTNEFIICEVILNGRSFDKKRFGIITSTEDILAYFKNKKASDSFFLKENEGYVKNKKISTLQSNEQYSLMSDYKVVRFKLGTSYTYPSTSYPLAVGDYVRCEFYGEGDFEVIKKKGIIVFNSVDQEFSIKIGDSYYCFSDLEETSSVIKSISLLHRSDHKISIDLSDMKDTMQYMIHTGLTDDNYNNIFIGDYLTVEYSANFDGDTEIVLCQLVYDQDDGIVKYMEVPEESSDREHLSNRFFLQDDIKANNARIMLTQPRS